MTPIEPLQVSEVVERLEDIALGYECSALIERGVMEHLKPEVEAWRAKDVTPRTMRMRMRLVRENASSISNERTCRTSAETLRAAISSIRTLQSENEALRAAGEEAREASLDESAGQGTIALSPDTSEVTGKQFLDRAQRHARSNAHVDVQRLIIDCEALWEASHESELEQAIFELATAIMGRVAPPLEGFIRWPTTAEEAEAMEKIGFAYLKEHAPERLTEAGRAMPSPFPATPDEPGRSEAGVAMSARDVP